MLALISADSLCAADSQTLLEEDLTSLHGISGVCTQATKESGPMPGKAIRFYGIDFTHSENLSKEFSLRLIHLIRDALRCETSCPNGKLRSPFRDLIRLFTKFALAER